MGKVNEKLDVPAVRAKLEKLIVDRAELSSDQATEFSFHMTDWLQDMEDLRLAFETIDEVDDEVLFSVVLKFLLHTPAHVVSAAAAMTGETSDEMLV